MLKHVFILFLLLFNLSLWGQTPAQSLDESLEILSVSATDSYVELDSWRGYASVGTLSNQRPFCIQTLVLDTQIRVRIGFEMRCDSRLKPQWHWDEKRNLYQSEKDSEITVYCFLTRDPLLDCVKGDCWVWHSSRSSFSGYADDLYYLKQHTLNDQNQLDNRLLFSIKNLFFDKGLRSWKNRFYAQKTASSMQRYYAQTPTESAADVKVKTKQDGLFLTLEFVRALKTDNQDDISIVQGEHFALQMIVEQTGHILFFSPVINIWEEEEFETVAPSFEQDLDSEIRL